MIGSRNGIAPIWHQAISWNNDDKINVSWSLTIDVNELRNGPSNIQCLVLTVSAYAFFNCDTLQ